MKWLTWRKSRITLFLPEDCIETERINDMWNKGHLNNGMNVD